MTGNRAVIGAGAGLALVAALAFWPVVTGSRSFFHWDLRYEHVPVWHVTQEALLSGESPFWIDGQYCGNPLLFTQEAPLFYPLTVPLLSTGAPVHRLSDLFTLFHFWLAGFAGFLLLRDLDADPPSATFGGVAWMLSAKVLQSALWPNAVAVLALLPLVLLGALRICRGQRRSGLLWTAVGGGLSLLAARPHVLVAALPVLIAVVATGVLRAKNKRIVLRDLALAGVLAAALGAPSLVPSQVLFPHTSRAGGLSPEQRELASLTGDIDQLFLPTDGRTRNPEPAAYPGVLVAILFVVGIAFAFRRPVAFPRALFAGVALGGLVGFVFAFGERGPLGLFTGLPLLRDLRVPARYLTSWSLALAVGSALVLSGVLRRARNPAAIGALCVAGLTVDLAVHARRAGPTAPSAVYSSRPDLLAVVRRLLSTDEAGFPRRLWSLVVPPFLWTFDDAQMLASTKRHEPLYGGIGLTFGLELASGSGPSLSRWKQLFADPVPRNAALGGVGAIVLPAARPTSAPVGEPQSLSVRRVAGLPRAILVPEAIVVSPARAIAAALDPSLDPRRTAVLEEGPPLSADPRWDSRSASVRLLDRGPGRVTLRANLPADGVLVVFNTYEKGWRAEVDGVAAPVVPADGAFQGVRLPAGDHVVELRYRPRGLLEGIGIGIAGALALALAAIRTRDA